MDSEIQSKVDVAGNTAERITALSPVKQRLLAAKIEQLRGASITIPHLVERDHLPLSFAQERLWFLHQFEPESTAYNIPRAFRLAGPLDVTALQQALSEIVRRHEVLRTTFRIQEGKTVQVIAPVAAVALPVVDFVEMSQEEREVAVQHEVTECFQVPFDLSVGPVFWSKLIRLQTETHLLLLNFHHIAVDGWSHGVFTRELSVLYASYLEGRDGSLPALPVQYADYAVWQRQWLQGRKLERHLEYWHQQLANAPTLALPTDHPRPPQQTYAGAKHAFTLSPELAANLKTFNQREGVTPFMTLLGVFQVLLSRYTAQKDILVGTPIANRQRVELEELMGFFVNTLVLRCDLSGEPDFCGLVQRIRKTALDAYEHQDLPFEKLVEELNPVRDQSRNPLFQVTFALQNAPKHSLSLSGLEVSPYSLTQDTTHFDLELQFSEQGNSWFGMFVFNTNLFDRNTIERTTGHYITLLESALANSDQPVSQLPMLSPAERHQLLVEWNQTEREYPRDKCVHQLFEEQVERTPDAVALVFEGQSMTYHELNGRANQLAWHLRSLGADPNVLVGLCVERSLEMVVGLLGILKAGSAYLPLEPAFPLERLVFMAEDAVMSVLVTARDVANRLGKHAARVVWLDEFTGNPSQRTRPAKARRLRWPM